MSADRTSVEAHARAEARAADALRSPEPLDALAAVASDATLPADVRAAYAAADPDGVRIAALLIAKLRFERLMRGSDDAAAWFERDPAGFTDAFRRYHRTVAPIAFWPADEARSFEAWTREE